MTSSPVSPKTTKSRKHGFLWITGVGFFVLAATLQMESFQGKMTRMRRLKATTMLSQKVIERSTTTMSIVTSTSSSSDTDDTMVVASSPKKADHPGTPSATPKATAYWFDPASVDGTYNGSNPQVLQVRQWGCARRYEAPLIFVHLGKCGGGSVRARLAASALEYDREHWGDTKSDTSYYYPMRDHNQRGIFVSSKFYNFRPSFPHHDNNNNVTQSQLDKADEIWRTFEKTLPCHATTPLGQAVACPLPSLHDNIQGSCHDDYCHVVYAGHNLLGNELHWLPTSFLHKWWQTTPWASSSSFTKNNHPTTTTLSLSSWWQERSTKWNNNNNNSSSSHDDCYFHENQDHPYHYYKAHYWNCVHPREQAIDQEVVQALPASLHDDWSPLYASMPVLRITMMREPFGWLVSKFFWHRHLHNGRMRGHGGKWVPLDSCDTTTNHNNNVTTTLDDIVAWVGPAALQQIHHLCGEDCLVRLHAGIMTLPQLETQARHNLLQSFAVVGLLEETPLFYDMITTRVAYMNTSLHPHVTGEKHSTKAHVEYQRCHQVYQTPEFQHALLAACPELQILLRLYHVGAMVNQRQRQEMETCQQSTEEVS
jgi:hypothetical protein